MNPVSQCNAGVVQCCNSVKSVIALLLIWRESTLTWTTRQSNSPIANVLTGLLGLVLDLHSLLGLECSPITGIGAAGDACSQQTVCCNGNTYVRGLSPTLHASELNWPL